MIRMKSQRPLIRINPTDISYSFLMPIHVKVCRPIETFTVNKVHISFVK